jgi:hypothetical protein
MIVIVLSTGGGHDTAIMAQTGQFSSGRSIS